MLISKNLNIYQIIKTTWLSNIFIITFCSVVYYIDTNILYKFTLPLAFPALMGTAIAFFIGFNNNQAYNRWWEARIIWGSLTNDSRSWVRNLICYSQDQNIAKKMIYRHLAFINALNMLLREYHLYDYKQYLSNDDVDKLSQTSHIPNTILTMQAKDLKILYARGQVDHYEFNVLNNLIQNFCNEMGRAERIKNTVFPANYIYFTKFFIWIFIALITMSTLSTVGIYAIILGWIMGFVFNTIHLNGMSIMNPFEYNPSAVPINSITRNIEINILEQLGEKDIPKPLKPIDNEYIL